jgi:hypothetical protein
MISFNKVTLILTAAFVGIFFIGCSGSGGGGGTLANLPPRIAGTPLLAVLYGEPYSFTPLASDPDGDALSFDIQNKPAWADFDTATGKLSGIPLFADTGMYSNISITVSDGQATASTPQFSIEVLQTQLGSATLTWTAPTQYADGSALTDLSAVKIYFGDRQGYYPNQILIDNPSITTYVVEYLELKTYYFVTTALNSQGVESLASNAVQFSVE